VGKVFFDVGVPLDGAIVKAVFERAGAYVLGRRMFEEARRAGPRRRPSARRYSCSRIMRASRGSTRRR